MCEMRCGVRCKTRDFSFSGHLYVLHGAVVQGDAQEVQSGWDVGGVNRGLWGWQRLNGGYGLFVYCSSPSI